MLQHVVSVTPVVAGIAACRIRFLNLNHVAIPLPDGRITKVKVQQPLTKYFIVKVKAQQKGKVKVQQKLTKYFSMRPKAGRPGAEAPRRHRRRHPSPYHHLPRRFSAVLDHITIIIPSLAVAPLSAQPG
jgi:hypothetical protein